MPAPHAIGDQTGHGILYYSTLLSYQAKRKGTRLRGAWRFDATVLVPMTDNMPTTHKTNTIVTIHAIGATITVRTSPQIDAIRTARAICTKDTIRTPPTTDTIVTAQTIRTALTIRTFGATLTA